MKCDSNNGERHIKTKVHNSESQRSHLLFYSIEGVRGATSVEYKKSMSVSRSPFGDSVT